MNSLSSGHWYPVLSSRELGQKPVARTRFGSRIVFWRSSQGEVQCMTDRCAHRGAALSLGKVCGDTIQCPFHGFRFAPDGRCVRVPAEGKDWPIPGHFRVDTWPVVEADDFVWTWRGPEVAAADRPPPPALDIVDGMFFGEIHYEWQAHYTRAIENVLDYSHLPFVHRKSIGAFVRDPVTRVRIENHDGGFLFFQVRDRNSDRQYVDFRYPNLWFNRVGKNYLLGATFIPVDDEHTEVYVRWYHRVPRPFHPLVNVLGRFSQYLVFNDDLPIVASQRPANVDDAEGDRLVPSDGGLIAFRKLRKFHRTQFADALNAQKGTHTAS